MGADYTFYVKTIKTHARAFFKVIIFSIGSVAMLSFKTSACLRGVGVSPYADGPKVTVH